ncbi:hypothetical protein IGI04_003690 [Brassica rapa subsp. trilocularis]|uniref:Uncharacterized protein n=1 Tax=Brassica rapa subsp. trilocularis TaxID=1813537 RepID=A0ABQ7NZ71_BRACM|nr:hypothetical protein IGI04_003690 [Brassica rapa subsp. trilocularis]
MLLNTRSHPKVPKSTSFPLLTFKVYAPPGIAAQPSPVTQTPQQEAVPSSSSANNLHPQRTVSFLAPPLNLLSPRGNHNPGTQILALLNNNNNGGGAAANQEPPSRPLDE